MRGLLPSVWLVGAALYAVSILFLSKPFLGAENWPAPLPVNETVVAKTPLAVALKPGFAGEALVTPAAFTPAVNPKVERHDEWVQVAGYTTMVRSRPSLDAPPLFAYAVGRPLRVLAREGHFVRVQDLGSGKLGWIEASSLVPFSGGYRQHEDVIAGPQIAAAAPHAPAVAPQIIAATAPQIIAAAGPQAIAKHQPPVVAAKKVRPLRNDAIAAQAKQDSVATIEPQRRGLFGWRRSEVQRVALGNQGTGLAGMVDRALRGF